MRKTISIDKKVAWGIFSVAMLGLISSASMILSAGKIRDTSISIGTRWFPSTAKSAEILGTAANYRKAQFEYLVAASPETRKRIEALLDQEAKTLTIQHQLLQPLLESPEEKQLFDSATRDWQQVVTLQEKVGAVVKAGNSEAASILLAGEVGGVFEKYANAVKKMNAISYGRGIEAVANAQGAYESYRNRAYGWIAVQLMFGLALGLWISRLAARGIRQVPGAVVKLATKSDTDSPDKKAA